MSFFSQIALSALLGISVSLLASLLIVSTRRWHGTISLDSLSGPQKVQRNAVPRVGGVAVFAGFWAAGIAAPPMIREYLVIMGSCGLLAFAVGLTEDLTKKISGTVRLVATLISGLAFSIVTGYSVTRIDIPLIDQYVLIYPWVTISFTAFAIAGIAHSINIIDGFNGLSAGGVIIMLSAFGVVAISAGDSQLAGLSIIIAAALTGFLLVNFPLGLLIMGDGGAYVVGFLLAAVGVMLPERNPDVSPWVVLVVLGYPVLETLYSILRKTLRKGGGPGRADKAHLHHLIYRCLKRVVRGTVAMRFANPLVSSILWGAIVASLVFVLIAPHTRSWSLPAIAVQAALYLTAYRSAIVILRRLKRRRP